MSNMLSSVVAHDQGKQEMKSQSLPGIAAMEAKMERTATLGEWLRGGSSMGMECGNGEGVVAQGRVVAAMLLLLFCRGGEEGRRARSGRELVRIEIFGVRI